MELQPGPSEIFPGSETQICTYVIHKQFQHFENYLNPTYLFWLSHPSSSVARLSVDEPALAWIMTHDLAKDLCAYRSCINWLIDLLMGLILKEN